MDSRNVLAGITGAAVGLGVGAGLMYVLDPERGNRRRALIKDQLDHARKRASEGVKATASDIRNRSKGLAHDLRQKLTSEEEAAVGDEVLRARVRASLGHVVSNPSSVVVTADGGRVTLAGPVLAAEEEALVEEISRVSGVEAVRNLLEAHESPESVPGLQGAG